MVNVAFYCRRSKMNRKGLAQIEMSVICNGKRSLFGIGQYHSPLTFLKDSKRGELKVYLSSLEAQIHSYALSLQMANKLSTEALKRAFQTGSTVERYSVKNLIDDYLRHIDGTVKDKTYESYVTASKMIYECISPDADVNDISVETVERFAKLQRNRGYSANYQLVNFSRFKTFFQYGVDNNRITVRNPFRGLKMPKSEAHFEMMSDDDYNKLVNAHFEQANMEAVRKYYVLACCCGLACCDLLSVDKDNIKEIAGQTVIIGKRQKTNVQYTSVVLEDGVDVLNELNYDLSPLHYSNVRLNQMGKRLSKELGLSCDLHTHMCRHFYITRLIKKGVSISIVKRCAGHSNIKMTESYLSLNLEDVVNGVKEKR